MPEPTPRLDENGFVVLDPEFRAQAVIACDLCDDDGYHGTLVCDHQDHRPAAERGMARIRAVLTKDRLGGDDTAGTPKSRERCAGPRESASGGES